MTEPFHFPDGRLANDAKDLLELCKQYPDEATNFLVREDLEKWLAYIGDYEAAECATNARQTDFGDRQKLEEFLNRCHSLTVQQPVPAAVPETKTDANPTVPTPTEPETSPESPVVSVPSAPTESVVAPTPPQPAIVTTPANSTVTDNEEKPSFFQVVAKFIMKILYRNKA
ncbi:MAG: hypothetical protein AAFY16_09320 [Cyanobacteria bacterium J06642_3]